MALKNASVRETDKSKRTHVFGNPLGHVKNKILYIQGPHSYPRSI